MKGIFYKNPEYIPFCRNIFFTQDQVKTFSEVLDIIVDKIKKANESKVQTRLLTNQTENYGEKESYNSFTSMIFVNNKNYVGYNRQLNVTEMNLMKERILTEFQPFTP